MRDPKVVSHSKLFYNVKIPLEWTVKKLKEILIEGRLGGNYENAEANTGIPVIKMGNLDRGVIKIDKIQNLPENQEFNKEDILKEGDLLFNTRNTLELVGKVAIWKNELPLALYNSNLMRLKFDRNFVESNWFMNYAFNSRYGLKQLRGIATGTTSVAAIYGRDLESISFLLPPLSEQKTISHILSLLDSAINRNDRIILQKEVRKKWLLNILLTGKKRLKGFNGKWNELRFGDITKNFSRRNKDLIDAKVYSVTNSNGFVLQSSHFEREIAGDDLSNYKIIKKNEFAYNPARINVGSIAYFEDEIGIISSLYVCFSTKKNILDYYLLQYLQLEHTRHRIGSLGEGGVRVYLWYDLFSKIKINLPTIEEQQAIVKVLQTADQEIRALKNKTENLRKQKNGLMELLLTGKIRTCQ